MDSDEGVHKKKSKGKKPDPKKQESENKQGAKNGPLKVLYCSICSVPPEYCSLGKTKVECKAWLEATHPDLFIVVYPPNAEPEVPVLEEKIEESKETVVVAAVDAPKEGAVDAPKEGVDALKEGEDKPKKKKKVVKIVDTNRVIISVKQRMKNKFITSVSGLDKFSINLNDASKIFAKKYASGCSVSENTIEIQGDISYELSEFISEKWPQITEEMIDIKEQKNK